MHRKYIYWFSGLMLLGSILIIMVLMVFFRNQRKTTDLEKEKYQAYILAEKLRQSSDDLTRFCRTYIATGNEFWKTEYYRILAIRNGLLPRANGSQISMADTMRKMGYSSYELSQLAIAEERSNKLVILEESAFALIEHVSDQKAKNEVQRIKALSMVFDENYHQIKTTIMQPIDEVDKSLVERYKQMQTKLYKQSYQWIWVAVLFVFIQLIISLMMVKILIKRERQEVYLNRKISDKDKWYKSIFETSRDALCVLNNGIVVECNPAFLALFGYSGMPEIVDRSFKSLLDEESIAQFEDYRVETARSTEYNVENIELSGITSSGERVPFEMGGVALFVENKSYVVLFLRSLKQYKSEQQQLLDMKERAEKGHREKISMMYRLSYDIRTPLNTILGFSDLLVNETVSGEKKNKYIQYIHDRADALHDIVEEVFEFSMVESDMVKANYSQGDINLIIDEVVKLLGDKAVVKANKALSFRVEKGLLDERRFIATDFYIIRKLFKILMLNALEYSQKGCVVLGYQLNVDRGQLLFYVKDSGKGMSSVEVKRLFKSNYANEDNYLVDSTENIRLGLILAKKLLKIIGGSLWVQSEIDVGTVFYFTIPYQAVAPPRNVEEYPEELDSLDWDNYSLLVVEDDEYNVYFIRDILKPTGMNITIVGNGHDAIEQYRQNSHYDLVLLDIRLPDMDGYAVVRALKNMNPQCVVVAQTSFNCSDERSKCIENGCSDYIAKPFLKRDLLAMLSKFLH